jgi:hypothetical protein
MYKSDPPGAIISGSQHGGGTFSYYTPMKLSYPDLRIANTCLEIPSPSVRWPDGTSLPSTKLRLCHTNSEYTFSKPAPPQTFQPAIQAKPAITVDIDDAKAKCVDLGFKSGTEGFGNCVLKLSK